MKCEVVEFDNSYWVNITPETMEEQAMLVRMGVNSLQKTQVMVDVYSDLTVKCSLRTEKNKRPESRIYSKSSGLKK